MVKTPKTRHSKSHRDPVTIELQPGEVSRVVDEQVSAEAHQGQATTDTAAEQTAPEDAVLHETAQASGADFEQREEAEAVSRAETERADLGDGLAARPVQAGRGGLNGVAAGLIGGAIALICAGVLQYAGILGTLGGSASLDGVNRDIAALKTQVGAIANSENDGDAAARVKMLSDGLDQTKADLEALKSSTSTDTVLAVNDLREKVAAMETAVADLGKAENAAPADLSPINEKITALEALAKSSTDTATEQQSRLGALEQSLTQLSSKVEAQASQPKVALSIAASALKAALGRGDSFSAELETFAAIAPDAPQLAALRPHAEKGVATDVDIASGLDAAASAMVAAGKPVDENAGFLQNLMDSAEKLVKVRPVGVVEGSGVPETVARLEAAVKQGDYTKALAEYAALPDAAKAAGADFAAKLKARVDVETEIDALIANAMKA